MSIIPIFQVLIGEEPHALLCQRAVLLKGQGQQVLHKRTEKLIMRIFLLSFFFIVFIFFIFLLEPGLCNTDTQSGKGGGLTF